jgi:hypothetical protein
MYIYLGLLTIFDAVMVLLSTLKHPELALVSVCTILIAQSMFTIGYYLKEQLDKIRQELKDIRISK